MLDINISKEDLNELSIKDKKIIIYYGIKNRGYFEEHGYKINTGILKFNLLEECGREIAVNYFPMLPLINESSPLNEADYLIYGHFYARFHNFRDYVKKRLKSWIKLENMDLI